MPTYEAPEWGKADAIYDAHTLKILGNEVMEDWELPYMNRLGEVATLNSGTILELGYGMGLSSSSIEAHEITEHTVVEAHPSVMQRCIEDNKQAIIDGHMHLFSGFWQNVTPMIRSTLFNGILFDTYPLKEEEMIGPHMFFFDEAHRLLKPDGVLTYYSDEAKSLSKPHLNRLINAGFKIEDIDFEICEVTPPENCEYWQDNTIVVPVIRKR
jgi:guanidinoacetate N-methyltransferase